MQWRDIGRVVLVKCELEDHPVVNIVHFLKNTISLHLLATPRKNHVAHSSG
jgi:hypothetical protein